MMIRNTAASTLVAGEKNSKMRFVVNMISATALVVSSIAIIYQVGVFAGAVIGRNMVSIKNYDPNEDGEQCVTDYSGQCQAHSTLPNKKSTVDQSHVTVFNNIIERLVAMKKTSDKDLPHGQCGLYLAPSTLPHDGLGLFSGSTIPYDHSANEYIGGAFPGYNDDEDPSLWTDLYIPIADDYKALPYQGQQ